MTTHMPVLAALALCLAALAPPASAADEKAAENAKARRAAAQKVYKGIFDRSQVDVSSPLDVERMHQWSRRWLEADRELAGTKEGRVAAIQAHLDRMKKLEDVVRHWHRKGFVSSADVPAVEFYRLEAERWLAQARGD
jgi:hypothetical protein